NASAAGGNFNFSVIAANGCNWTASRGANDWINITAGSGSGNGTVSYSVAANPSASARQGAITVGNATYTVSQSGTTCTYQLSSNGTNIGAAGGNGSFSITTQNGCSWTANPSDNWITITAGASGTGNGTVNFSVAANPGNQRTGSIVAGGQTFTIT